MLRCGGRCRGKAFFAYLPPQLRRALRRRADEVPVKGILAGGNGFYRDGVGRVRSAGRKVVGTDAHSGAARRDGQRQPQGGVPAVQPDGVAVQRGAGQNVLAAGQPRGGNALRVGKNGLGAAGAQHLPFVQNDHLFAQAVGLVPVVGHQQGSARKVYQQAAYLALYLLPQVAVQRAEGLVQHQNAGLAHQNARQRGALLLSAGKLGGVALGKRFQPHGTQHFGASGAAGQSSVEVPGSMHSQGALQGVGEKKTIK